MNIYNLRRGEGHKNRETGLLLILHNIAHRQGRPEHPPVWWHKRTKIVDNVSLLGLLNPSILWAPSAQISRGSPILWSRSPYGISLKNRLLEPRHTWISAISPSFGACAFLTLVVEWPALQSSTLAFSSWTTSTFLELELATTLTKSSKSYTTPPGRFLICCSTPWWKLSALMKVCPRSKNFRVMSSPEVVSLLTRVTSDDSWHQFIFCALQLSTQNMLWRTSLLQCCDVCRCYFCCTSPCCSLVPQDRCSCFFSSLRQMSHGIPWCGG